jgi:cytochrome b
LSGAREAGDGLSQTKVKVWDLPIRLFHWLLIPLIAFSWWSAETARLDWHRLSGYGVLSLVAFRLAWGLVGSDTARFAHFLKGPRGMRSHFAANANAKAPALGHTALGGWSVLAMLVLLAAQVVLGLFAIDVDGIESGPLAVFVSFDQGRLAAKAHHLVFNLLLGLIVLHVLAIMYYAAIARRNLIGPMITGAKSFAVAPDKAPVMGSPWLALIVFVAAACLAYAASQSFWAF